jgi:hypothetical protein
MYTGTSSSVIVGSEISVTIAGLLSMRNRKESFIGMNTRFEIMDRLLHLLQKKENHIYTFLG